MKKILINSIVLLILSLNFYSQTGTTPAGTDQAGAVYDQLLAKLKGGDTKIDYKALRAAFTDTKGFGPLGGDPRGLSEMAGMIDDKKYKEAIKAAEAKLKTNYVDIDAHLVCAIAHRELKDTAKADFHKAVYLGLINSIMSGADGKSAKTAYHVIAITEENAVLRVLGLRKDGQSLVNDDGHKFDVIDVTDPKTKVTSEIYFNIDLLWKGYDKMFSK
jgi:hypothetical protein